MSPPKRRRSARLASATAKSRAVPGLSCVAERDESPARELPKVPASPPRPTPATPASSTPRPAHREMHPSKTHPTMGEPSSALRLGFSDIKDAKRRDSQRGSGLDSTPSKTGSVPSSSFTFRVARQHVDTGLSNSAQRMMDELREEAAKIKADLVAQREADETSAGDVNERTFAKPKGKSRRFSAAHMAEFKKMDSIEGHASAWRAQHGRFTPVKSSLKRSPSKANLDATPTPRKSTDSQSKMQPEETPNVRSKPSLKRTSSVADLDTRPPLPKKTEVGVTPSKDRTPAKGHIPFSTKRLKKRSEDDASTARPISRDGSSIPRLTLSAKKPSTATQIPGFTRLMSPTKPSMAHLTDVAKPTISLVAPSPKPSFGNLPKSATTDSVASAQKTLELKRRIISPGRFQKVKSILRGHKSDSDNAKTAIPQPVVSQAQTPAPPRLNKELPPVPFTTPRRKLAKHVTFTPEATRAVMMEDSPSPQKASIAGKTKPLFAGLDSVLAKTQSSDVVYPDLSGLQHLIEPETKSTNVTSPSVPGTFTFRSDRTIQFGGVSPAFGVSPGQSSVRVVRGSTKTASDMPGSFPDPCSPSSHPNKENTVLSPPKMLLGAPHGMSNKKRNRATSDDEDAEKEAAERAAKKRRNEDVVLRLLGSTPAGNKKTRLDRAPGQTPSQTPGRPLGRTPGRPLGHTPGRTPGRAPAPAGSETPSKKRPMLSMSRLNMLARPKKRT